MSFEKQKKDWATRHNKIYQPGQNKNKAMDTIRFHGLEDVLTGPPLTILDVGVGHGDMAELLKKHGHRVIGIDIVKEARVKVEGIADEFVLTEDLINHSPFHADLALCHLTIQHCNDAQVLDLLTGLFIQTKPNAFGSFQVASQQGQLKPNLQKEVEVEHLVLRSVDRFIEIGREAGWNRSQLVREENRYVKNWSILWHMVLTYKL